ncbi:MAG: SpoIIE family protein phosphatase [Culturomica sp.]|jgi:sigma-B regulation protein RsbU (phosphoserine phosphatase)|nr:SpoIIE family protein phosphatase [Culturomica sp.]
MKKRHFGFTKQLTLYVLLAILIVSTSVFLGILYFSRSFAEEQAFRQANLLSDEVVKKLESKIHELEQIPKRIVALLGEVDKHVENELPSRVLNSYAYLNACRIYDEQAVPEERCCREAYRNDRRIFQQQTKRRLDTAGIVRRTSGVGFWRLRYFNPDSVLLCYSEPFLSSGNPQRLKFIEMEIRVDRLLDFLQEMKIFRSGYVFLATHTGHWLAHPDPEIKALGSVDRYVEKFRYNASFLPELGRRFKNGDTGYDYLDRGGIRHGVYYTPAPLFNWRIGIVCPSRETLEPHNRFCRLLSFALLAGAFGVFFVVLWITRKHMNPLRDFTANVRAIADGNWEVELSDIRSAAGELNELHNAFKYMQHNMLAYVDQLKNTTEENERMNTEIRLARKIQNRFLPQPVVRSKEVEIQGKLQQSKSVGGDLYEYFIIDNRLYFAIGDVSGKGIPAALYMASIIKLFRYVAARENSSARICNTINSHICDSTEDDMFVTLFTGILDLDTGVVTFSNAGHPNPLLIDGSGEVTSFSEDADIPIGILEDHKYKEYRLTLDPGSKLLLFTDGITDAESRSAEFFGLQNLIESIRRAAGTGAKELVETVSHSVAEHTRGVEQFDDMTLLVIHYKAKEKR